MKRGEIYRTHEKLPERGGKPGFYVVVSRNFVAANDDLATVICAPVYSEILGLETELVLDPRDGLPRGSAARCDFLTLLFKHKLTTYVGLLSPSRIHDLNRALACALEIAVAED
ncbi:MAG: type II toxin-antitoxin system PemK/MazF family toxin [Deltaproteobacteria bacterium]|nr:type II toxin-antitoxin system PemK/MazF family toxin [Deltaproteobacteria bacterium]